jgi:UDP-glucose 4-epimerase
VRALIIGGAGYLGGHVLRALLGSGWEVAVIDNLSFGHRDVVPKRIPFYGRECGLIVAVEDVFREQTFDVAIYCAGLNGSAMSREFPLHYYHNNFIAIYYLLKTLLEQRVYRFLFSSDFSVYDPDIDGEIDEKTPKNPQTPLGRSLLAVEGLLRDLAENCGLRYAILRAGVLAGTVPTDGFLGNGSCALLNDIFSVVRGRKAAVTICGKGTAPKNIAPKMDYVHVCDVADAYALAAQATALENGTELLLGTGHTLTEEDVVHVAERILQRSIPVNLRERLPWEPAHICVNYALAANAFGWRPRRDLRDCIESAWRAPEKFPENGHKMSIS